MNMNVKFNYKIPNSKDGVVKTIKPFRLESEPRCYCCSNILTTEEKQHKSKFSYYDSEGRKVGTVETYVCFSCVDKIMET